MTRTKKKGQAEAEMILTTGIISSITDLKKPRKKGSERFREFINYFPFIDNTFSLAPCTDCPKSLTDYSRKEISLCHKLKSECVPNKN